MRISSKEHQFIKTYFDSHIPESKVYLFGSRVNKSKKGGDIDLLLLNEKKIKISQKVKFISAFIMAFGEKKMDLVSYTFEEDVPFKRIALENAIEL